MIVAGIIFVAIGALFVIALCVAAAERFESAPASEPRPLPVAYVVRDERLDITPALRRAR